MNRTMQSAGEKKKVRVVENARVKLERISEKKIGGRSFFVMNSQREDGSEFDREVITEARELQFAFTDLERTPLTEAKVLGKNVDVPEGVLGILEFEIMSIADKRTRNNTLYPLSEFIREIKAYNKNYIATGRAWGGKKHPGWDEDFRIEFDTAAVRWFMLKMDNKTGIVSGAGFLLDKKEGTDIRAGLRSGGAVCVSSRGWGCIEKYSEYEGIHGTVEDVWVLDEYILEGYDIVTDPGVLEAESTNFYSEALKLNPPIQQTETKATKGNQAMTLQEFKEKYPELYKSIVAEAKSEGRIESAEQFGRATEGIKAKTIAELTEGQNAKLIPREAVESAEAKAAELQAQAEAAEVKAAELQAKVEAAEAKAAELQAKVEAAEAARQKAEVQAQVEAALTDHTHKEAIKARLTEADLMTLESALAAIEREMEFHQSHYNIPAAPIDKKKLERLGRASEVDEDLDPAVEDATGGEFMAKIQRIGGY